MTGKSAGRLVLAGTTLLFAIGTTACSDPEADARAAAQAKAKSEAAAASDKAKRGALHAIECLNAIQWQEAALSRAHIGSLDVYRDYFENAADTALGGELFAGDPPRPALSRPTLSDYRKWSYADDVKTKFTAGTDANGDGKVDGNERSARGFAITVACIQEAAEAGKGPLAGNDKNARMYRMQDLRKMLKDKDA